MDRHQPKLSLGDERPYLDGVTVWRRINGKEEGRTLSVVTASTFRMTATTPAAALAWCWKSYVSSREFRRRRQPNPRKRSAPSLLAGQAPVTSSGRSHALSSTPRTAPPLRTRRLTQFPLAAPIHWLRPLTLHLSVRRLRVKDAVTVIELGRRFPFPWPRTRGDRLAQTRSGRRQFGPPINLRLLRLGHRAPTAATPIPWLRCKRRSPRSRTTAHNVARHWPLGERDSFPAARVRCSEAAHRVSRRHNSVYLIESKLCRNGLPLTWTMPCGSGEMI